MRRWRGCWGLWPLLALSLLIFALCEVLTHIRTEQEWIPLQAIAPKVERPKGSSPLPTSETTLGKERAKHAGIHVQMPCPGSSGIGVSTVSIPPLGLVTCTWAS